VDERSIDLHSYGERAEVRSARGRLLLFGVDGAAGGAPVQRTIVKLSRRVRDFRRDAVAVMVTV
jgi:hypothetical protein